MIIKLEGTVKDTEVDLIIVESKTAAIHFKLENKLLIYNKIKLSNYQKENIVDKDWRPDVEYVDKENFATALREYKPNLDWETEEN